MTQVRLQNARSSLFQHFSKGPFGKETLSCSNRQMGLASQLGHHIHVLTLDRLFDEKWLIGLQLLDQ